MKLYQLILLFVVPACHAQSSTESNTDSAHRDSQVVVAMEGKTHRLDCVTWLNSTVTTVDDDIRFYLVQDGKPIQVNLNMKLDAISENGSVVFYVPEANHDEITIELSFMNLERDSSRMQKRIVFNKGIIEIAEYSENKLRMTFDGSGKPLLGDKAFPIKGLINVEFDY